MSALSITVVESTPRLVAAVRHQATQSTLPRLAIASPAWAQVYSRNLPSSQIGIIIYWDEGEQSLYSAGGVPADIGVEVLAPFESDATLALVQTPAGRTATLRHHGSYDGLVQVHRAIRDWARDAGHGLAGPNWEIYAQWHEEDDKRITDVFYLLA